MLKKLFKYLTDENKKDKSRIENCFNRMQIQMDRADLNTRQKKMVYSILELGEYTARDIMVPRIDVVSYNMAGNRSDLEKLLDNDTYSRIPVYEDNIDNIKGILHVKDLFTYLLKTPTKGSSKTTKKKIDLIKHMSEPYFVPESKKIIDILSDFQSKHIQFSIVVDEYGGFSGIVTMEDIIEEIIGDIQDEFDEESEQIKVLEAGNFSIDARINIEELNDFLKVSLPVDEVDTLGGFIIMMAGHIPKRGQEFVFENLKFKVITKKKNSILRVKVTYEANHENGEPVAEFEKAVADDALQSKA